MKKYIVAVDCEGVACTVGTPGASLTHGNDFSFAKKQATREANAAARALFDAGAGQVIVWDNHGSSLNLDYDLLDPRCDIALGVGWCGRFPVIDKSFSGVAFIGYHAADSTIDGVLCHTYSSTKFQYLKFNGRIVGELAMDAAVAGCFGVPPIFVSSDDKAVAEAKSFFDPIETVITKQGLGWNGALSKHPIRVLEEISQGIRKAVELNSQWAPFSFENRIEAELRFKRIEDAEAASRKRSWERLDAYTVVRSFDSILDFFQTGF